MSSAEWTRRDAAVLWHGFTQMASFPGDLPVIVERAEGRELIDVEGRRYLDAIEKRNTEAFIAQHGDVGMQP